MNAQSLLAPIRIVLVGTTHPGNIGAAARAMKNMGLQNLALVQPQHFPHEQATALASGAADILAHAGLFQSLPEALADCSLVMAASARPRRSEWPCMDAREAALRLVQASADGPVALVFGRERSGLSNSELQHCQVLVQIPADAEYSSLNLAQAVQVLCYELRMASTAPLPQRPRQFPPAAAAERERFYQHLQDVLEQSQFLNPNNPRYLMRRLRLLFDRTDMDQNELNILRGMLTAILQWVARERGISPNAAAQSSGDALDSGPSAGSPRDV